MTDDYIIGTLNAFNPLLTGFFTFSPQGIWGRVFILISLLMGSGEHGYLPSQILDYNFLKG